MFLLMLAALIIVLKIDPIFDRALDDFFQNRRNAKWMAIEQEKIKREKNKPSPELQSDIDQLYYLDKLINKKV
jgi:hypothetical protein